MKPDSPACPLAITETAEGVIFGVHVQPRASRNEICGVQGTEMRLRLTSPPVEGAANKLCGDFLAKLLGIAKSRVSIVAGDKSRHKTIRIEGVTAHDVMRLLPEQESK